jgi:hypothetical protein
MDKTSGKNYKFSTTSKVLKKKTTPEDGALKRRNASSGGLEVWLHVIKVLPKGSCVIIIQKRTDLFFSRRGKCLL